MHGSIIGNKLSQAQKKSGVTQEKLDASKPVVTAAANRNLRWMLCKRKVALETKNKGVAEADKTEDVAEMKRITDGMDAEAKTLKD
jgi:hypothetical protein